MEHALGYSDRMIALKAGKVFFDRPTAQVTRADLKDVFDA
jgi:phosphonate transport system ATP-binding protein